MNEEDLKHSHLFPLDNKYNKDVGGELHICSSSNLRISKGSRGQHHPQLHSEFQASHGNKRLCLKKQNGKKHKEVIYICFMKITVGERQLAL